jgi:hypothetical protein
LESTEIAGFSDKVQAPQRFLFGPFDILSTLPLPELTPFAGAAAFDSGRIPVEIRPGEVPSDLPGAAAFGRHCRVTPTQYLLHIAHVAGFYAANGNRVTVQLAPDAPDPDVSTYLLGSVFGALCHQNHLLPLHASAVERGGMVSAFLGDSGAGKSTLAACLQRRGHRIVSDDICLLAPEAADSGETADLRVVPVAGWLKLWRASLHHLGESPDERHRVYSADDKYRLFLEARAEEEARGGRRPVLQNLVFLTRSAEPNTTPRLEPLPTIETITRMMEQVYLAYIPELTRTNARIFRQCARVMAGARGFRLVVPWGFDQMEGVLDLLERELLGRPGQAR